MTVTKSQDFQFKVYSRPTGLGTGTYDHCRSRGASVEIERSLFEGDLLTITSTRKNQDVQIDKVRPVRFYWKERNCSTAASGRQNTITGRINIVTLLPQLTAGRRNLQPSGLTLLRQKECSTQGNP